MTMASIPVPRTLSLGWISGKFSNCERTSGEALNNTQCSPSDEIAIDDWLRVLALIDPALTALQFGQLQFH